MDGHWVAFEVGQEEMVGFVVEVVEFWGWLAGDG